MSDISEPMRPEDVPNIEKLFERLPITVNVGFPQLLGGPGLDATVIGWSNAWRNLDDGSTTVVMTLDPEASKMLKDLTEVFKLYSMGFAGIKSRPQ